MVVSLLATQVKLSDEYDWVKLERVLKYLKWTKYMKLTLSVYYLALVNWCIDASKNTHE